MSSGKSALVLGATGAVGKTLLIDLLKSGTFKTITTIVRKEFEYNGPNKEVLSSILKKLDDYKEAFTGSFDTVFCTLGTTRAEAGSSEDFVKGYVIDSAKLIKQQNPLTNLHFLYYSSVASKANSLLYMRSKSEIEEELESIGFNAISIFRPVFLKTDKVRDKAELVERLFFNLINLFDYVVPKRFVVHVDTVGKAMRRIAVDNDVDVAIDTTVLENGTLVNDISHYQIHEIGN